MKYLCVCSGGNVRSVTLAFILKHYDQDAMAISVKFNSEKTFKMMSKWADVIYVVEPHLRKAIPDKYQKKVKIINVGPDIWKHSLDKDLIKKFLKLLKINPGILENGIRKRLNKSTKDD